MISVVTYGRNDNYGFNLYKRTALGFNCLAEILTDEDEILFVDYNTPGHLPTLPEFIWDTLTEKALNLIKVVRISPAIHEQTRGDSPLPILENVSRNAAIVRSNPQNRWVLSTNPDIILVLASRWASLGELLSKRPDSFYEMPRFDIPEGVWSSLRRAEPRANMQALRDWVIAHGAAIAEPANYPFQKIFLFDAPGDFQLAPRNYYFRVRGFDESMNKYLHSDSNLAKRMWLLNGQRTDHLLGELWVLHQDHYLSGEWARNVSTIVHNDYHRKVINQETIEANEDDWGLQKLDLPFYQLAEKAHAGHVHFAQQPLTTNGDLPLSREIDWRLQAYYRLSHYQPGVLALYLRQVLEVMPPRADVAYLGENSETSRHVRRAWEEVSPEGSPVRDLSHQPWSGEQVSPDVLLIDCHYERPEYWERRIQLLREQLLRQREKGRISERDVDDELSRFADNVDSETHWSQLERLWTQFFPILRMRPGAYVVLLGCDPYVGTLVRFQELFSTQVTGVTAERTWIRRLHAFYQTLKYRMQAQNEHNLAVKIFWGLRLLKRRTLRKIIGHESFMGWIYFLHVTRATRKMAATLNLRRLYVHNRLVVMQVEA